MIILVPLGVGVKLLVLHQRPCLYRKGNILPWWKGGSSQAALYSKGRVSFTTRVPPESSTGMVAPDVMLGHSRGFPEPFAVFYSTVFDLFPEGLGSGRGIIHTEVCMKPK